MCGMKKARAFLSIQAQDFIEEKRYDHRDPDTEIPEHSSSGLH